MDQAFQYIRLQIPIPVNPAPRRAREIGSGTEVPFWGEVSKIFWLY